MRIDVFTLFPGWFDWFREQRHVQNAIALGHAIEAVDLRTTTPLRAGQVDDTPYGGGAGMVMRADVWVQALRAIHGDDHPRTVVLTPRGRPLTQALAVELAREPRLVVCCGRYEGIDERAHELLATDEI